LVGFLGGATFPDRMQAARRPNTKQKKIEQIKGETRVGAKQHTSNGVKEHTPPVEKSHIDDEHGQQRPLGLAELQLGSVEEQADQCERTNEVECLSRE
jgi:hypothetical protein